MQRAARQPPSSGRGADAGRTSIPYIAGRGEEGALGAVTKTAETIDAIASRTEDAMSRNELST